MVVAADRGALLTGLGALSAAEPAADVTDGSGEAAGSAGAGGTEEAPEEVPVWQDPYAQALKDMDFSALRQHFRLTPKCARFQNKIS